MRQFDKYTWAQAFVSNRNKAPWRCGVCWSGTLQLDEQSFKKHKRVINSATLRCSNEHCQKRFSLVGKQKFFEGKYEVSPTYIRITEHRLYPSHFQPELPLFELPKELSESAKESMQLSFNHFWYDLDACINKLRQCLEILVLENGGVGTSLHQKIDSLGQILGEDIKQKLLALKWIGNEGSHSGPDFTREQVLNTYELLSSVFLKLYPDHSKEEEMQKFVSRVLDNKGIKGQ